MMQALDLKQLLGGLVSDQAQLVLGKISVGSTRAAHRFVGLLHPMRLTLR